MLGSIATVGDAYDNAMAESFVDSFKTELIKDRVWQTRSQLELAIVEWVAWFNDRRLHEALGDIPPAEFEAAHHARQAAISGDRSVTVLAPNAANGLTTRRLRPINADLAPGRLTPSDDDPHVQTALAKTAPEVVVRRALPSGLSDEMG